MPNGVEEKWNWSGMKLELEIRTITILECNWVLMELEWNWSLTKTRASMRVEWNRIQQE